jgi:hypothetical protein
MVLDVLISDRIISNVQTNQINFGIRLKKDWINILRFKEFMRIFVKLVKSDIDDFNFEYLCHNTLFYIKCFYNLILLI